MATTAILRTEKDLEIMDQIFWKLLGSSDVLRKARKAGIHIVIDPDTESFLIKRYGEKADEAVQLTHQEIGHCPYCARLKKMSME